MLKKFRPFISTALLLLALLLGFYYLGSHATLYHQLLKTPLSTTVFIFLLYIVMFFVLAAVFAATIKICGVILPNRENFFLNANSMILNFFVPGQSGPAYRGFYLFTKYKIKIKSFILATLIYFGIYALVNTCLLFVPTRPWWQSTLAIVAACLVSYFAIKLYMSKNHLKENVLSLSTKNVMYLLAATLAQSILQLVIYAVELHSVNHGIKLSQMITYTGAANLALFVSITPGGIGIREAFVLFTKRLNHISSTNIIGASFIDRSVFVIFLIIMVIGMITIHFKSNGRQLSFKNVLSGSQNLDDAKENENS